MDSTPEIKSCILLASIPYKIPREILTLPPDMESDTKFMSLGFLEDSFKMAIFKPTDTTLCVEFYRRLKCPKEKRDDGYALRFHFTLVGSDEGTKTDIMRHTEEMVSTVFNLSERTLAKAKSPYYYFDLFVTVEMLEYKSLDINEGRKDFFEGYMSHIYNITSDENVKHLSYILKSPELRDTFTGRLPYSMARYVLLIISEISKNLSKYAKFLEDKSKNIESDVDVRGLLFYLGRVSKERPLSLRSLVQLYIRAHKLGLDFLKIMTSDYLLKMQINDSTFLLDILGAALLVQDNDLFEKAVVSFLRHFQEIKQSERFEEFSKYKATVLRFIMHAVRVWVTNNDVYIPGWNQPIPTTEL